MKKTGIAALSFCLILTASADPLMQWVSDNAAGGPGSVVDSNGSPLPPTTDWIVELVDTSDQSVLFSTTAGFQTAAGRFIETPNATAWNGLHVKTVIYNANSTNAATMKAEFSNTVLLSWGTDPAPYAVVRYNAGSVEAMDWQPSVFNEAPVAFNGSDTVDENGSVDITLVATDADNDPLIYSVVDQPANGSVNISGNRATYTPDAAYYGSDSFTFKANDGTEDSNVATVNITVNPVAPLGAPASDINVFGTVSGILADAYDNNDLYQAVTEAVSGDTSALEHRWTFNVIADELVTFYVEAHHTANSEGDDIVFAYSTNGVDWVDMVTVSKTTDDNTLQFFPLPTQNGGTNYVRALDTDRTSGNTALDTVYVDTIFIYSEASTAAPTSAHTPVPANGAVDMAVDVDLSWIAGLMTASHDVYFGTSPSPDFQGNQAGTVFDPGTLLNDTTYYWAVDEVNNSGTTTGSVWSFTTVALPNTPPAFTVDPIVEANGVENVAYSGTIADDASDPESDPMTFSKVSGPTWLSVASDGTLSGTPGTGDVGLNAFTVQVDATGGSDTATLNITVDTAPSPPVAPSGLTAVAVSTTRVNLSWADNADDETGFRIERSDRTAGSYAEIAAVGVDITSFSDATVRKGTTYFYRIRATNAMGDSAYSNEASAATPRK